MTVTQQEIDAVVDHCRAELGDQGRWITPKGYPDSLALCVIDAIYSTGSHYTSVVNVINRYREASGHHDGAKALLQTIADAGGARGWASTVAKNLKPAHTRAGAPLKADVIEQAAQLLIGLDIDTVDDLVAQVSPNVTANPVHDGWKKLPSQSSGVTYGYLLLLAGLPSVKPDRMVLRFLSSVIGLESQISTRRAVDLITAAAERLDVSPRTLDHMVWRAASGRELTA